MLDPQEILKQNVRALLKSKPGSRIKKASDMDVADGSLGRIVYGTGNPTLEVLTRIATHFNKEPWQLLAPNCGADVQGSSLQPPAVAKHISQLAATGASRQEIIGYLLGELVQAAPPHVGADQLSTLQAFLSQLLAGPALSPDLDETLPPQFSTEQARVVKTHGTITSAEQLKLRNRQLDKVSPKKAKLAPLPKGVREKS